MATSIESTPKFSVVVGQSHVLFCHPEPVLERVIVAVGVPVVSSVSFPVLWSIHTLKPYVGAPVAVSVRFVSVLVLVTSKPFAVTLLLV